MSPVKKNDPQEDESGDSQSSGGQSSKVDIRIASMAGDSRDEPRTPAERRHLAIVHAETHADRVRRAMERQKALTASRERGPERLNERQPYQHGMGSGGGGQPSPYKAHPISQTAYFSGTEESPIPSESQQDLNLDDRNKLEDRLENKLQNRLSLKQKPHYTPPKPRPY